MTNKMNPEAKAKIVAALRSGKYEQGHGYLRDAQNCFCVWGVIADQADPTQWEQTNHGIYRYEDSDVFVPETAARYMALPPSQSWVQINGIHDSLMGHNDSGLVTFAQLADAIEEQL